MMGSVASRASEAEAVTDCVSSAIHHSTAKFAKPSPCMDMAWPVNIQQKVASEPGLGLRRSRPADRQACFLFHGLSLLREESLEMARDGPGPGPIHRVVLDAVDPLGPQ